MAHGQAPEEVRNRMENQNLQAGQAGGQVTAIQPVAPLIPQDLSQEIGSTLYGIALEAGGNGCGCGVCVKARKLATLLARQLEIAGRTAGVR